MDQELKQRLIGAAVITALAAIFVPMLFDDPIDESGKTINELKIPALPSKAQDVEIMPLPEKVEDVATVAPEDRPSAPAPEPAVVYEGEEDVDIEMLKQPRAVISEKEAAVSPKAKSVEPALNLADEEDVALPAEKITPAKAVKAAPTPVVVDEEPVKVVKPAAVDSAGKPSAAAQNATIRWYLNAGSFSKKENALTMQENLKKQGFAASIKEAASDKGPVYKVRVGPMLDKAKAQEVKAKLAQINVNTFVSGDE
ncbi:MAG: SPOR domain-containing protein [Methylomonas sp.]|nr:SPOR domain-containing protein [Methylomonas sp.]